MVPAPTERDAFYAASLVGLRALDARERSPRRFGAEADARWAAFRGALGLSDRLDLLQRDAAVTWGEAFSPALAFGLPGLPEDEPFGSDWRGLADDRARRLLETPETRRRCSLPDDAGAYLDAARAWLLDRIEALFRAQPQPELLSARQVALELGRDAAALAVHELLTEATGQDLRRLVADLLDAEGVPFLAALRYTETGLEKRAAWEKTWDLQRAEDAGRLAEALAAQKLSAIPVPDKYGSVDFQRHYWGLRGALDVPKERFITVPVGSTDDDPTLLVGWGAWDHLQQAQALAALTQRRRDEDGWDRPRLLPLLAGLDERVPWLLRWHDEPSEPFGGVRLGGFFKDFVGSQAHALGASLNDLRAWRPEPASGRGRRPSLTDADLLAALGAWTDEQNPRPEDLSETLGVGKAVIAKALKALVESGQMTQTTGRPARYKAVGA